MKQVIELLEAARKKECREDYDVGVRLAIAYLRELQNPTPMTPEQYREIEGEEYRKLALVYFLEDNGVVPPYWDHDTYEDYIFFHKGKICVCAYSLKGPPADDWRPE